MAKKEKIVDLKQKPENVTDEDLKKLQTAVSNMNQSFIELGRLTASQHSRLHQLAGLQDEFEKLRVELGTTYGSEDINIQTGKINYKEDVEADKKD